MTNIDALEKHLRFQLGTWPPEGLLTVAASPRRETPGWDCHVRPFAALMTPEGTVVSVAPRNLDAVTEIASPWGTPAFDRALAAVLGTPETRRVELTDVFRWCAAAPAGADAGEWVEPADERVPAWLKPFNGGVLCAWGEDGAYIGGVGVKHHDEYADEIAVGTEPAARGKGLARQLVATAARTIEGNGRVATYVHEPGNHASAHVADAAGFPDRGWRLGGFWVPRAEESS